MSLQYKIVDKSIKFLSHNTYLLPPKPEYSFLHKMILVFDGVNERVLSVMLYYVSSI